MNGNDRVRSIGRHIGTAVRRAGARPAPAGDAGSDDPPDEEALPPDLDPATVATIERVRPYTMTSPERIHALCNAVRYLCAHEIPGDLVECGVWRGGSMMAAARTLVEMGDTSRDLYLFDTFEGMPPPGRHDRRFDDVAAEELLAAADPRVGDSVWCVASLDEVRSNLCSVGYPAERIHLVKGLVEDTIPESAPEQIAILRLDTDWYESTRHELVQLFPRVSAGGVLIIDDYGWWQGAQRAVDEYLAGVQFPVLLTRVDETGRLAVVFSQHA